MSKLSEIHGDMRADWNRLQADWQIARKHWNDEIGEHFERGRWQNWDKQAPAFLSALKELEETARNALRAIR